MPEYVVRAEISPDVDAFTRAYLEAAEWAGIDDEQRDAFEEAENPRWDAHSLQTIIATCRDFQASNAGLLEGIDPSQAGHDFYLTRNRHGAGFWDRGYPDHIGRALTDAAHAYGETSVYFDSESETLTEDQYGRAEFPRLSETE